MREKRYSKSMKGTQGKEGERYPFLEVFPLKRKAIREINEREGGFEDGANTEYENMLELSYREPEEKEAKEEEEIREVFAGAGLEIKEMKRGDYTTLFSIEGKLII